MAVQDDKREIQMCRLLKLQRGTTRGGIDAHLTVGGKTRKHAVPIEVKSTTNDSVSTARDVGIEHICKWRKRMWIFGFYDKKGKTLERLLCLKPSQMAKWIDKIDAYIKPDFSIGAQAAKRLTLDDLFIVCGEKAKYTIDDARALHKRQWSAKEYRQQQDLPDGYSPTRMLDILRLRAVYLNERGSTLNNPHIPNTHFAQFKSLVLDVANMTTDELVAAVHRAIRAGSKELKKG